MPDGRVSEHALTEFAEVRDGQLVYPPVELELEV